MISKLLKEYVQLFEARDKDAEKKLIMHAATSPIISTDEEMLMKHGITPIMRHNDGEVNVLGASFLGAGSYAHVYEVSYKGKRAAAKISSNEHDILMLKKLSDLRKKVPRQFVKHLPVVYTIFYDDDTMQHVAIVELLEPLNIHLKSLLFGVGSKFPSQLISILRDEHYITSVVETAVNGIKNKLNGAAVDAIVKNVSKLVSTSNYQIDTFRTDYRNMTKKLKDVVDSTVKIIQPELSNSSEIHNIITVIKQNLHHVINDSIFPATSYNDLQIKLSKKFPGIENLIKLLQFLKEKFQIRWSDINDENLMQRPSTGDIVISDPGLFMYFGTNESKLPVGDMHFHKPGNIEEPKTRASLKKHLKDLKTKGFEIKNENDKTQVATSKNLKLDEPGMIVEPDVRKSIKKYFKKMKLSK